MKIAFYIVLSLIAIFVGFTIFLGFEKGNKIIGLLFFIIATITFAIKGWIQENFYQIQENKPQYDFFTYYSIEVDRVLRSKFNILVFLPLLEGARSNEERKIKIQVNTLFVIMYASLTLTFVF